MHTFLTKFRRPGYRLIAAAGVILLGGCSSVEIPIVETGHLKPVVQRYDVTAGVYFDGEFQEFLHTEERIGGNDWEIFLGQAQLTLFERVLAASFKEHIVVEDIQNVDAFDVDLVLYPKILEYAYLAPEDSGSDFYAVSIKYKFKVYDDAGNEVTEWTVTAYGKNRSSLGRGKASLSEATNIALRDAAAAIIIEFESNGELLALISPNLEAETSNEPTAEPAGDDVGLETEST